MLAFKKFSEILYRHYKHWLLACVFIIHLLFPPSMKCILYTWVLLWCKSLDLGEQIQTYFFSHRVYSQGERNSHAIKHIKWLTQESCLGEADSLHRPLSRPCTYFSISNVVFFFLKRVPDFRFWKTQTFPCLHGIMKVDNGSFFQSTRSGRKSQLKGGGKKEHRRRLAHSGRGPVRAEKEQRPAEELREVNSQELREWKFCMRKCRVP